MKRSKPDRFINTELPNEAGRILGRRRRPIKPSTLAMDCSRIEAHIKPLLAKRPIGFLKLVDIEGAQSDIAAGKTAKPHAGSRRCQDRRGRRRGSHDVDASRHFPARRSPG